MRLNLLSKAAVSLAIVTSLSSCTKQRIYDFGVENKHDDWTVLATIDDTEQKLVFDFKGKQEEVHAGVFFSFYFAFDNAAGERETISNKDDLTKQFEYKLNDGTEIEFDENGQYEFHTSKTINVWYNYADRKVKNAITERKFNCDFGLGHYEPYGSRK